MYTCKETYWPCRDGVKIYTKIYLPAEEGTFPTVLIRTPYDSVPSFNEDYEIALRKHYLDGGYALVVQHCRGTYNSEGEFSATMQERNDGLDALEHIRQMPSYNGEIFLDGTSYTATVHFAYLDTKPHDVKAAMFCVQPCIPYLKEYVNGQFKHSHVTAWHVARRAVKQPLPEGEEYKFPHYLKKAKPIKNLFPILFGRENPEYTKDLIHPDARDPFWNDPNQVGVVSDQMERLEIPILFRGGWYDPYVEGLVQMWDQIPPETRKKCGLIIGPWGHSMKIKEPTPIPLPGTLVAEKNLSVNFFDHVRKGTPLSFAEEGKVKYYVMNGRGWKTADSLSGVLTKTFSLSQDGLLTEEQAEAGERSYAYDPENPPSMPGSIHSLNTTYGGFCEIPAFERSDILSFASRPIEEPMLLDGCSELTLKVRSDCEDTAFLARVNALTADGKKLLFGETITALRYELGDYTPNEEVTITLRFSAGAWLFHKGDRLVLDIASANFPVFHAHTNTAEPWYEAEETKVAHNTVICGASCLKVPLSPCAEDAFEGKR